MISMNKDPTGRYEGFQEFRKMFLVLFPQPWQPFMAWHLSRQSQSVGHLPALAPIFSHPRYHDLLSLSAISLRIYMHQTSF